MSGEYLSLLGDAVVQASIVLLVVGLSPVSDAFRNIVVWAEPRRTSVPLRSGAVVAGSKGTVSAAIALSATLLVFAAHAAETTTPEGVLIIHSNQRPTPAAIVIEDTLQSVVPNALGRPVEFFSEYLDVERFSIRAYADAEAEFLRQKYRGRNIRVIVAAAPQALQYITEFRARILAGVPVVHIAVPRDQLEPMALPADIVGKTVDLDPTATFELALRLHPNTKRLVIVAGAAERDRIWEQRLRDAVGRLQGRLEVEYLLGLPTADLLHRLGALTQGTIVYSPGYFVDGAGHVGTPRQSLELIASASAVPVYGPLDTFLGTGIVGGYMAPYQDQAKQAGTVVARLLNGAAPTEIATSSVSNLLLVDWRQIRRWGIDERRLPPDTVVRFREPTAWDKYWREISVGIAILVLQAGLIAALLIERRSRLRTAIALEDSEKRMTLAAGAGRLSTWSWEVARDKNWRAPSLQPLAGQPNKSPENLEDVLKTVHSADREEVERAIRRAVAKNEELDIEYRVSGADGEVRWTAARGRPEKGHGQRLFGVALDVTERKAAQLQAEQDRTALRHMARVSMLGQLSASIAHQLNQPLAAILGNAEAARKMLAREPVNVAELREICDDIVTEDHRAAEVIRRLGALFKRGELQAQPLDVNELVRETLDLVRTDLVMRHVTPLTDLAPSLPVVDGNRVQLQQVLLNLIVNAADAMAGTDDAERQLLIRTDLNDCGVRMCVTDRGSGIAAADLERVFDPFWSTKPGGVGIGLALCRSIVAAHRGTLTVANNPDRGTTFCATVPVREPA